MRIETLLERLTEIEDVAKSHAISIPLVRDLKIELIKELEKATPEMKAEKERVDAEAQEMEE